LDPDAFPGRTLRGHLRDGEQTENQPAIMDLPPGVGRVVLFATNPYYRWQNHGEFTMLCTSTTSTDFPGTMPAPPT
jgi:hypothetical protein